MKNVFNKLIILIVVFAVVVGGFIYLNRDKTKAVKVVMGQPTLPTMTFFVTGDTEGGETIEVNELFGYTTEMETKYMRDAITPISSDRELTLRVKNNKNVVMAAEFEIRSLDCERLIEKTQVEAEDILSDGDYTNIILHIDNMINQDTEYFLTVKIVTDMHESIYYYTRIAMYTTNHCREEIDFATFFSNATFDKNQSTDIVNYLEPNASEDNTNLGLVTIHSNYNQITWGNLAPEKVTTPIVKIQEVLGDVGCFELMYKVKALNDYDTYQYYTVKEFFRIKWTADEIYLLDYRRTMNQIFDANNQNISPYRVNLGICESDTQEFRANEDTSFIAFVKESGLWLMDIAKNEVYSLFVFEDAESDDIRTANKQNNIQIVSVDEKGNTQFIVYGYMNRGEHEGMVGVSLYSYNASKNVVEEKIFIPFTRQYDILKETMGQLSFVNDDNIMYVMLSNNVYSIDLSGSEYVQIISDLKDNMFAVNDAGNIVAWEVDGDGYGSTKIRLLNFMTGQEQEILAGDGQKLKILGFVDDDIVYGIAYQQDILKDKNGNVTVGMYKAVIMDFEGNELKDYSKDGYYISDAEVTENMINFTRMTKTPDGQGYVKAEDSQIFGNEEEDQGVVTLDTITTELKKTEKVITFVRKVTASSQLKEVYPKEIQFSETNALSIRELISDDDKYYVYAQGEIKIITDSISEAINNAYDYAGVVIGDDGDYVWARISRPTAYTLSGVSISATAADGNGNDELAACLGGLLAYNGVNIDTGAQLSAGKTSLEIIRENIKDKDVLDLTGCTFTEILYYVCNGQPVLAAIDSNNYVLIVGYDFYNAIMLDPSTGQTYKNGQEETEAMFNGTGNKFIVVN